MVRPADAQFGDYQANLALGLAKALRQKPRDIAQAIADRLLPQQDWFERVEIAGPGFINLTLSKAAVAQATQRMLLDPRLGVELPAAAQRVVVDYGSPNLAKEMHIGHLRSTIIGDAIVRVLRFAGHAVILQNHIGDWGTPFGMLLEQLIDEGWDQAGDHKLSDLNALYERARAHFEAEPAFAERSRQRVVRLQGGDADTLAFWQRLIVESCSHMNQVFQKLGVLLGDADLRGESFFNSRLSKVVEDLRAAGLLVESDGAQVVFCEGFTSKSGAPLPLIVQKSDGGYGYAATDLAAARFRTQELGAQRVVYVVDARQSDHFAMVFWTLRAAGWIGPDVTLEHVAFGTILGADKKPFKTRSGGVVKLAEVLDEAVVRARAALESKDRGLGSAELESISRAVGTGAVKYADLSSDRIKDYVFDYDRMLALEGNTAPYLQYAYVRVQSILRRAREEGVAAHANAALIVTEPVERQLMLLLLRLPRVIDQVVRSLEPHRLCVYLYELASLVHQFHERCPVLKAPDAAVQASRLALSDLAGRSLRLGLELLGVSVVDRM
jgi:arginyl-tRNA synthetase